MQGKFAYIRTYTHILPQPSSMHRMTSCMSKEMQKEALQWCLHWADVGVHWGPCSRNTTTQWTATYHLKGQALKEVESSSYLCSELDRRWQSGKGSNHKVQKVGSITKCEEEKCSVATAWARTFKLHAFLTLDIPDLYMYGGKTWNASKHDLKARHYRWDASVTLLVSSPCGTEFRTEPSWRS